MLLLVVSTITLLHCDIIVGFALTGGITTPWRFSGTLTGEGTFLDIGVAEVACTHTIVGVAARIEAVQDVHLTETDTWHTLLTAFVPPAVGKGDAQMPLVFQSLVVTAADKV